MCICIIRQYLLPSLRNFSISYLHILIIHNNWFHWDIFIHEHNIFLSYSPSHSYYSPYSYTKIFLNCKVLFIYSSNSFCFYGLSHVTISAILGEFCHSVAPKKKKNSSTSFLYLDTSSGLFSLAFLELSEGMG